jgi:uncharacterized protein (UPF0332 family)
MESSVKELSKYRFECCQEALEDARIMFDAGRYKNALNRSYYAIFHAIRSVNALQGFDSGKHSGVISYFNQNYVKTEIFPKEVSKIIKVASEKRESADYLDFYIASKEDTQLQIERATEFKGLVEEYLKKKAVL